MTELGQPAEARLDAPCRIQGLPFAETIDVAAAGADAAEPSPCLPTATSVWYQIRPEHAGMLAIDLGGSTPLDAVVRLYRPARATPGALEFVGCASPVWNGQLSLEVPVQRNDLLLAQVGTSESHRGRIVVRAELHR